MAAQKQPRDTKPLTAPCQLCGGTAFTWGRLPDTFHFNENARNILGLTRPARPLHARACETCGNVLLFVEQESG